MEKREDGKAVVEATIKVHVGGERIISTAEGNGPVNALDAALRQAIASKYPHLADIELVNYKVRILDENKGTGAVTRVLLDASDGDDTWGSIGVSENVIEASWEALVDSIEYGMVRSRRPDEGRRRRRARPAPAGAFGRVEVAGDERHCRFAGDAVELLDRPAYEAGARITGDAEMAAVRLLAPVAPGKIVAVGLNYRAHADELQMAVQAEPILFMKPPTAVIGPGETIVRPARSTQVDYEAELVVVVGRRCKDVLAGPGRRVRRRLHLRQRRHGPRPAEAGRAVDARQELRHVLPARALGRARGPAARRRA